jgi:hypothetical protein
MINLPKSTIVNRFVPKEKFYSKTIINTRLRQLFTNEVEKILWTNKISPQTLNITADEYKELQVFEITLKGSDLNPAVIKHIDSNIPYPILFILKRGRERKASIAFKERISAKSSQMRIISTFETSWSEELKLQLNGLSVDEIYKNFLYQIAPHLEINKALTVKSAVENQITREKIQKEIDALNRAIKSEPSISKQQDLARKRFILEQELVTSVY